MYFLRGYNGLHIVPAAMINYFENIKIRMQEEINLFTRLYKLHFSNTPIRNSS